MRWFIGRYDQHDRNANIKTSPKLIWSFFSPNSNYNSKPFGIDLILRMNSAVET